MLPRLLSPSDKILNFRWDDLIFDQYMKQDGMFTPVPVPRNPMKRIVPRRKSAFDIRRNNPRRKNSTKVLKKSQSYINSGKKDEVVYIVGRSLLEINDACLKEEFQRILNNI